MERWGVIFDWDGVIVLSAQLHDEAWRRLAQKLGRSIPPEFFARSFGMKNERAIQELLGWTDDPKELDRLSQAKEEEFRRLVRERGITPVPGAEQLVHALREQRVPYAVGSSTPRQNIDCVLEVLRWKDLFPIMVTAEDVSRGKPDPQVFLIAAERLGLPPGRCVVIEDAPVGIEAARNAKMKVVGVSTMHPRERLANADLIVRDLTELTVQKLCSLVAEICREVK